MLRVETVEFFCEKAPYGVGDVVVVVICQVITRRGSMQTRFEGVFFFFTLKGYVALR